MHSIKKNKCFKQVILFMAFCMIILGSVPKVDAFFVSSVDTYSKTVRNDDIRTIQRCLENKKVQERLKVLGYDDSEIRDRVDNLSDRELHQLASNIDSLSTGGDGIGFVIGVLLAILLVVLILRLLDKEVIII